MAQRIIAPSTSHGCRCRRVTDGTLSSRPLKTEVRCCANNSTQTRSWNFRKGGNSSDKWTIFKALISEKLNPLSLDLDRFLVATDVQTDQIAGFVQIKPLDRPHTHELSSLVVLPEHRSRGLGSLLVREALGPSSPGLQSGDQVFIITISRLLQFYARCGFTLVPQDAEIPITLRIERAIGSLIAMAAVQDDLVIMRWTKI
jgi:N-acetylglutamate synthase-like GNAT family acetyltransferase